MREERLSGPFRTRVGERVDVPDEAGATRSAVAGQLLPQRAEVGVRANSCRWVVGEHTLGQRLQLVIHDVAVVPPHTKHREIISPPSSPSSSSAAAAARDRTRS